MGSKNSLLKKMIGEWEEYTEEDRSPSVPEFAEWLYGKYAEHQEVDLPEEIIQEIETESLNNTVARHVGRLIQFASIWTKLAFRGTAFRGFEDYGMTQYILHTQAPTKSTLVDWSMLERSTAFEIIRRLQKLGLVKEFPDPNDRRTKRVKITRKGKVALNKADVRVDQISVLLLGDLTEHRKISLLQNILRLNIFHAKEYEKGTDAAAGKWFPDK